MKTRRQAKKDLKKKTLIMIPKTETIDPEPEPKKNQSILGPIVLSEKRTSKMNDRTSESNQEDQPPIATKPSKTVPNQELQEP